MAAPLSDPGDASPDEKRAKLRAFLKAKRESVQREIPGQQVKGKMAPANHTSSNKIIGNTESWLEAFDAVAKSDHQSTSFLSQPLSNMNDFHGTQLPGNHLAPQLHPTPQLRGVKSRGALSTLERAELELQQKKQADRREQESQKSLLWIIGTAIAVLVPVIIFFAYQTSSSMSKRFFGGETATHETTSDTPSQPATPQRSQSNGSTSPSGLFGSVTGSETKRYVLEAGVATFTINRNGPHHLHVVFNSGLIAEADWKENPLNEFGYDIYEPQVSQDINKLALMIMLRGIIANYLNGKY
jgi:hypothetical protein